MLKFEDLQGAHVELTFGPNLHQIESRHVLVIIKHDNRWLLTKHRIRGIEFPGGKAELGETIEQAAIRETMEETGVTVENIHSFAEYVVFTDPPFCKAVFTGDITHVEKDFTLMETEGVVWMTDAELDACTELSFHMKDRGMGELRKWVEANDRTN
ncbi:nucleoside triphosphatase [Sporosarcina sp. P21c]|uniref:NUDIX hydrolase n=1 Tax=unclassified Sporosarcina TaxID=2647733 RepID=UPI000C16FDEE|nr:MULTISPECIES: NUDIX domain-containing protein [unclassified Sporosarcina]PIC66999.1 nucleoside triphosphatase [Sporosarcina sp. P16a]PIC83337.1 nucleoside triphosphatase [Sporosarcina sp. P1]PIC88584.1 nucleoside triphosphatase [Sporosarcina sp. P21c]PIC92451.1 nucleoside triphosphatase [Sporosarcina sp. P25]